MKDQITVIGVTEAEKDEIRYGINMRRQALLKEEKRLQEMGLGNGPVRQALDLHEGDGSTGGLAFKFASAEDTLDMFQDPEPTGEIRTQVPHDDVGVADSWESLAHLYLYLESLLHDWLAEDPHPLLLDSDGHVFRLEPELICQVKYIGEKCGTEECWELASIGRFCAIHYMPADPEEEEEEEPEITSSVLGEKRKLARQMIAEASFLSVPRRKNLLEYLDQGADEDWIQEILDGIEEEKIPALPHGWVSTEGEPESPFQGLEWASKAARELAEAQGVPVEYLKPTGAGRKIRKRDVEDAISAWISAEARKADQDE